MKHFKLLKGAECFAPLYLGKKDVLVVYNKIYSVADSIPDDLLPDMEVLDLRGKFIFPGLIDQHVHISGGGGEEGPHSSLSGLAAIDMLTAGVCTVVGILGTDGVTKSIAGLLSKARELENDGLTTYIYTGNYGIPPVTITGSIIDDLVYIDKIIGLGEIAISDHRSSHPTLQTLKELAAQVHIGGLLGKKPGIMHLHVGDGKRGIEDLFFLVEDSDFPINMFVPTHINRNKDLFNQGCKYCKIGGNIDLTAGESSDKGYSIPDALEILFNDEDINIDRVTISSDGNGSIPENCSVSDTAGQVMELFKDIRSSIVDKQLNITDVLKTVTLNVARILNIYPNKGNIQPGSDADILILEDSTFDIDMVMTGGNIIPISQKKIT